MTKMKIEKICKPWVFALIGGLLILGSSAISGIFISSLNSKKVEIDNKVEDLRGTLEEANRDYEIAQLENGLAYTQRLVTRYGVFQSADVQAIGDSVYAVSIYPVILKLRTASGLALDSSELKNLERLREKAESGEKQAYEKLMELVADLTSKSGDYRSGLIQEIAEKRIHRSEISADIEVARELAIFIQLLGLFVLLGKEIPFEKHGKHNESRKADA